MVTMIRLAADTSENLGRVVDAYALRNRSLNLSSQTVGWYSDILRQFTCWLEQRGEPATLESISTTSVRSYVLYLQERTPPRCPRKILSPSTIHGHVRALKAFGSFLHAEGYTSVNRLAGFPLPRLPHRVVDVLTPEEIKQILAAIARGTVSGFRNLCILWTSLDTGLRAGELATLKVANADLENGVLKVLGKGARERIVPMGRESQRLLHRYVAQVRPAPLHPDIDELFLTDDGLPITVNAIGRMIRRLGRRSGVSRLHTHLLRHTFATNYLVNGGDMVSLKRILGHASFEMVQRYVHFTDQDLMMRQHRFSPMDRMRVQRHPPRAEQRGRKPPV